MRRAFALMVILIWILPVQAADRHRHADIVGYRYNDESWWVLDTPLEKVDLSDFVERSEELKEILEMERRSPGYTRSFYGYQTLPFGKIRIRADVRLLFRSGKLMDIRIDGVADKPVMQDLITYLGSRYLKCEHGIDNAQDPHGGWWKDSDGDWITVVSMDFPEAVLIRYTRVNGDDEPPWHFN